MWESDHTSQFAHDSDYLLFSSGIIINGGVLFLSKVLQLMIWSLRTVISHSWLNIRETLITFQKD